ncbi:MAG: divergent polysaccharide deacetylase family protein [Spirochaetales bacterium]|nr:divergent polysaccharide deacetylase family protein [Spirochaetales bacterium]
MVNNKGNGIKPKKGQPRLNAYYLILGVIAVLLLFITIFLEFNGRKGETEEGMISEFIVPGDQPPEAESLIPEDPESNPDPYYVEESPAIIPIEKKDPEGTTDIPLKPEPVLKKGTLVFVIDDVGNNLDQLDKFLKVPGPIVFAVMPERKYTQESIRRIRAAGKMAIVHQPMEPVGNADPGKGAIFVDMDEDEIRRILDKNFSGTGWVGGINNHMGSRVTTDPDTMRVLLKYLKEKGMFFLDSATNSNLVGKEIALEIGLPYLKRNSMFLDNDSDRESILSAIREGQNTAVKKGHAVMIGHIMTEALADLLIELYPTFMEDGFTVKDLSDLLHGEYDVSAWD